MTQGYHQHLAGQLPKPAKASTTLHLVANSLLPPNPEILPRLFIALKIKFSLTVANKASVPWPEHPCHLILYHVLWFSKLWPDLPGQPALSTTDPSHMLFLLCTHLPAFYPPDSQGSCGEHEFENLSICYWSPLQSPLGLPIPLSKHMILFPSQLTSHFVGF